MESNGDVEKQHKMVTTQAIFICKIKFNDSY